MSGVAVELQRYLFYARAAQHSSILFRSASVTDEVAILEACVQESRRSLLAVVVIQGIDKTPLFVSRYSPNWKVYHDRLLGDERLTHMVNQRLYTSILIEAFL